MYTDSVLEYSGAPLLHQHGKKACRRRQRWARWGYERAAEERVGVSRRGGGRGRRSPRRRQGTTAREGGGKGCVCRWRRIRGRAPASSDGGEMDKWEPDRNRIGLVAGMGFAGLICLTICPLLVGPDKRKG
jgi:hypothetical protein